MSVVCDQSDATVANQILKDLLKNGVLNTATVVYNDPNVGGMSITPAAVAVLQGAIHFLNWQGEQSRDLSDMWDLFISTKIKDFPEELTREEILEVMYDGIRSSIITESKRQSNHKDMVVGVDLMMSAIFHTMHYPGVDISLAFTFLNFVESLDIKLINTSSGEVHSTLKFNKTSNYVSYWDFLEGIIVAVTLYPTISYHLTINGVMMIPKYDSCVELSKYPYQVSNLNYIQVLDSNFTNHYVYGECLDSPGAGVVEESGYAYLGFATQEFIKGLLSMTKTIGVQKPWKSAGTVFDISTLL